MERYLLKKAASQENNGLRHPSANGSNNNNHSSGNIHVDANCTFQPKILPRSEQLRGRSTHEMSRGDSLRLESNRQMIKRRQEQEEKQHLTFQPTISRKAKTKNSMLKLTEDPGSHLEWHKTKLDKREKERQEYFKSLQEKEVAECTFTPATIDCPAYIARIAKSMEIIKKARGVNNPPANKPLWK